MRGSAVEQGSKLYRKTFTVCSGMSSFLLFILSLFLLNQIELWISMVMPFQKPGQKMLPGTSCIYVMNATPAQTTTIITYDQRQWRIQTLILFCLGAGPSPRFEQYGVRVSFWSANCIKWWSVHLYTHLSSLDCNIV